MPDILDTLSDPALKEEILARRSRGETPLVITKAGSVGPGGEFGPPQPLGTTDPATMQRLEAQAVAEQAAAQRRYQDEITMADRFWGRDRPLARIQQPRLFEVGNQIVSIDPMSGSSQVMFKGEPRTVAPSPTIKPTVEKLDPVVKESLTQLGHSWAKAIEKGDTADADRIAQTVIATRRKWGLPMDGGMASPLDGPDPFQFVPSAPQASQRISVISPNGKIGSIPTSQLDAALKAGYKRH